MDISKLSQGLKYRGRFSGGRDLCVRVDRVYRQDGAWRADVAYGRGFQTRDIWDRWTVRVHLAESWEMYKQRQAEEKAHRSRCLAVSEDLNQLLAGFGIKADNGWWENDVTISGEVAGMERLSIILADALSAENTSALETLLS